MAVPLILAALIVAVGLVFCVAGAHLIGRAMVECDAMDRLRDASDSTI